MSLLSFQLPDKIVMEKANDFHGLFTFKPLQPGYGVTIGNAVRRVLLSSLEGYAITGLKIPGVQHEFSTIDGDNVFFKPKGASGFQSISIKQIQTLELKFGQIVIAPGLKIEAKYQNEFNNNNTIIGCLVFTIFMIAGVSLMVDGFDLGLGGGGGGSGHPSF